MSHSLAKTLASVPLLTLAALLAASSCIKPPPYDPSAVAASEVKVADEVNIVWDGDTKGGSAKEWANCNLEGGCKSTLKAAAGEGVNGSVGLEWHVEGKDWKGFGWNWFGFWPENAGTDVSGYDNLTFWLRLKADNPKLSPELKDLTVALACSTKGKEESAQVPLIGFVDDLADEEWHEIVVPLSDLKKGKGKEFDLTKAWEFRLGEYSMTDRNFTVFVDNIGFDNREVISLISLPEKRDPAPLGSDVLEVTAKLDLAAAGEPVSQGIYGVSFGDAEALHEMGVTVRRQGGNTSSVYDWRTGFSSAGHDWFFENRKEIPTPHPQENWWVVMHRENQKYGMTSFFTMPSEWVAKDDTSSGFPAEDYPDCEQIAPDRGGACIGKSKKKDAEGKPIEYECSKEHPTQNGKEVGLEYNVELVKYCIDDAGFGRAADGGVQIIALDNEPMLYTETHRDMWCEPFTYDGYWERTKKYAEMIRKVDPTVKIAAPALWGWTAYSLATADQEYREEHDIPWHELDKLPDYGKYGPFALDFMRRCAEYKERTGHNLIDIFVFHGYPMTPQLDWGNQAAFADPTPELQEFRVRDVRKFWDESYRDPETWMGKEAWADGNVAYVPLMKRWMKEAGWDVPIAVGEYDYAGPKGGLEISGAVAQAESFAAFARSGVSYAIYWDDPRKHGPVYFAFKMFRNPDGERTAVGDEFMVAEVSDDDSVGLYAFKDPKTKVASFIVTNKRAKKGAKVSLDLGVSVPAQKAKRYEYSEVNDKAIGELPPLPVKGQKLEFGIAPMSIVRIDVQM